MTQYVRTIRLTTPDTEPLTVGTVKDHLRVDGTDEDALITALIAVARDKAEKYCNRYFTTATAALLFDSLPTSDTPLYIPVPDIVSVDAVSYLDAAGASQAVAGTVYDAEYQYLFPADQWPGVEMLGARVAVTVGPPVSITAAKQAMLLFITDLYEYRGDLTERQIYDNEAATMLLQPYRVDMGI